MRLFLRVVQLFQEILNIPGSELNGVHFAMEFLKQQNKRVASKDPFANPNIESNIYSKEISAAGKML